MSAQNIGNYQPTEQVPQPANIPPPSQTLTPTDPVSQSSSDQPTRASVDTPKPTPVSNGIDASGSASVSQPAVAPAGQMPAVPVETPNIEAVETRPEPQTFNDDMQVDVDAGDDESIEMAETEATTATTVQAAISPTPKTQQTAPMTAGIQKPMAIVSSVEEVLLRQGKITAQQIEEVRAESINTGKEISDILLENSLISDDDLAQAKAEYYNIEFIKLNEVGVSPEALSLVSEGVAQRYQLLPFAVDKGKQLLSVAMSNPLDLRAIDFVEKKTGYRLKPYLTSKTQLPQIITERYSQSLSSEVTEALKDTATTSKKVVDVADLGEVIREAPIAKIVQTLLTFAVKSRASDIHIEPQENKTRVRYRIDGILHEKLVLPKGVQDAVVSRIKILADLKIDEKRLPQDGRFGFTMAKEEIDLRVSTLPTVHGEKVVMRLLKKSAKAPALTDLGLRGLALKHLETAIQVPNGIILITGPTGSGKTTTLYSILNRINTPRVNIVTLEDPVEYEISGVNQVQINNKAGLTFASGLRSFLRQDPNIIMVGEIRDQETAELAIQASLTGHLVFSTLHTNSAAGALPRLLDMGAEPFLLASSMTCLVAQRVVRQICVHCKEEFVPEKAVMDDFRKVLGPLFESYLSNKHIGVEDVKLFRSVGCPECNDTGYSGRIGIFEVLPVSERVAKLVMESSPAHLIERQAVADGMVLMKMDGYLKVLEGATTIEEVLRVAEVSERNDFQQVETVEHTQQSVDTKEISA